MFSPISEDYHIWNRRHPIGAAWHRTTCRIWLMMPCIVFVFPCFLFIFWLPSPTRVLADRRGLPYLDPTPPDWRGMASNYLANDATSQFVFRHFFSFSPLIFLVRSGSLCGEGSGRCDAWSAQVSAQHFVRFLRAVKRLDNRVGLVEYERLRCCFSQGGVVGERHPSNFASLPPFHLSFLFATTLITLSLFVLAWHSRVRTPALLHLNCRDGIEMRQGRPPVAQAIGRPRHFSSLTPSDFSSIVLRVLLVMSIVR